MSDAAQDMFLLITFRILYNYTFRSEYLFVITDKEITDKENFTYGLRYRDRKLMNVA